MSDDPANPHRESVSAHGPTRPGNRQDREPGDVDSAVTVEGAPMMRDELDAWAADLERQLAGNA